MFGFLTEKPKPIIKSGVKSHDNKVKKMLKKSKWLCVTCQKKDRIGSSLYCKRCIHKF